MKKIEMIACLFHEIPIIYTNLFGEKMRFEKCEQIVITADRTKHRRVISLKLTNCNGKHVTYAPADRCEPENQEQLDALVEFERAM